MNPFMWIVWGVVALLFLIVVLGTFPPALLAALADGVVAP